MENSLKTARTTVKRTPSRGVYDRETVNQILDEGFICHIGFVSTGQTFVIPTAYGRINDFLYIHGAPASHMLRSLVSGIEICLTVTLVDGIVLARSAFHHSFNYRSVVVFGTAEVVVDPKEKEDALFSFTEHVMPGRWAEVRVPNEMEMKKTLVLRLPIQEASAKVRTGGPNEDEEDLALPVWAGVLPLEMEAKELVPDPRLNSEITVPAYLKNYHRKSEQI